MLSVSALVVVVLWVQDDGSYAGFDPGEFTSRSGGKAEAVRHIRVGDGYKEGSGLIVHPINAYAGARLVDVDVDVYTQGWSWLAAHAARPAPHKDRVSQRHQSSLRATCADVPTPLAYAHAYGSLCASVFVYVCACVFPYVHRRCRKSTATTGW